MAAVNSSLVLWTQREIFPRGMFLTCSGSGGDRILFWQASPICYSGFNQEKFKVEISKSSTTNSTPSKLYNHATTHKNITKNSMESSESHIDTQSECKPKLGHNPFALSLILDSYSHTPDTGLNSNSVSSGTYSGFICSLSDRIVGHSSTLQSNLSMNQSLINNTTTLFNTGSTMNLGNLNQSFDSYLSDQSVDTITNAMVTVSSSGISSIGGIPTSLLLSLLHHQKTQALQSKIYLKLDENVFIGSAFNLTPCGSEMTATPDIYSARPILSQSDLDTSNLDSEIAQTYHSTLSFAVVFLMDMTAPPSVLSHYTELARLIGSQIRRAELVSGYLNKQREIITSVFEQTYANYTAWGDLNSLPTKPWTENLRYSATQHGCGCKRNSRPSPICIGKDLSTNTNDSDLGLVKGSNSDNQDLPEKKLLFPSSQNTLERLTEHSNLCAELKLIIESVCTTGHVNTQVNGLYPVFFCLPHRAYGLIDQAVSPTPAIRPSAVWRAMEKIRPYHSLILCLRKEQLFQSYLPPGISPTLVEFIQNLSPTTSLLNISQRMNTQNHCLNLALWLIYRGHAIIVYPIVANNVYILSPHSTAWFTPQLIAQFAATFPQVNFAELLASFSMGFSLKDCMTADETTTSTTSKGIKNSDPMHQNKTDSSNSTSVLTRLSFEKKLELITWLLRRRLILQVHLYVFANFSRFGNSSSSDQIPKHENSEQDEIGTSSSDNESTRSKQSLSSTSLCKNASKCTKNKMNPSLVIPNPSVDRLVPIRDPDEVNKTILGLSHETNCPIPNDLLSELSNNLPQKNKQLVLAAILTHSDIMKNISLLHLFVRILPHLPAHFEELMYVENVDRSTLTECIEQFSEFLLTARIPDPVTACFAGIPWSD